MPIRIFGRIAAKLKMFYAYILCVNSCIYGKFCSEPRENTDKESSRVIGSIL
jgi:hypothetical protein